MPNVDLVVQMDPPVDPKNFAHRCGRAGRAGRMGRAVVMLSEGREEQYVDLLKVRGIPVEPTHRIDASGGVLQGYDGEGIDKLVCQFRKFVQTDRAFHDKVLLWVMGVMVGDESVSVVCSGVLKTSSKFHLSD